MHFKAFADYDGI